MKNKLTGKVYRHSKSAGRESRSQSMERGDSEKEVLPSIKREYTLPDDSPPRKRKVRIKTQIQTPSNDIPGLNVRRKLFKVKAFDSLANEVPPSIKREPTFEGSEKIQSSKAKTRRKTFAKEASGHFIASSQNEENEVFPSIKRVPSFQDSAKLINPSVKTGRKFSASNFMTAYQNEENKVSLKSKEDQSSTECSAKVEKAHSVTMGRSFSTSKTRLERQWLPQRTPPTTPYALNRPQRNRIPPLAYWRGEHRSFRTLINGDIILVDFHIPEYTEEPRRKRRKLSEKKNLIKNIKTERDEDNY